MRQPFDLSDYLWPDVGQGRLPSLPTGVDRDWAPAFAVATFGGAIQDAATGNPGALSAAASFAPTPWGLNALLPSGSCYASLPSHGNYNILGPLTLVWVGIIDTLAQYQFLIARAAANGGRNNPFELRVNPGGGFQLLRANAASYATWSTTQSPPTWRPCVLVATHGGNLADAVGASLWINGEDCPAAQTVIGSGMATGNTEPLLLGTRDDNYTYMRGSVAAAIGFPRVLSDDEIRAISANPALAFGAPLRLPMPALTTAAPAALAGSAVAQSSASANLSTAIALAASAASVAGATGSLTAQIQLAGAALSVASASGSMSTPISLAGSALSVSAATGDLTAQITLAGAALAQAAASAGLTTGSGGLSATASAQANAGATLTTSIRLAGSALAQASASGSLGGQAALAANAAAQAGATSVLTTVIQLSAQAIAQAIAAGALTAQINLAGNAVASVAAGASLTVPLSYIVPAQRTISRVQVTSRIPAIQITRR